MLMKGETPVQDETIFLFYCNVLNFQSSIIEFYSELRSCTPPQQGNKCTFSFLARRMNQTIYSNVSDGSTVSSGSYE